MTVEQACNFFDEDPVIYRALDIVREVGLGYLRLGQSATELSGGEASGSSSQLNCKKPRKDPRSISWMNPQQACTLPMWKNYYFSSTSSQMRAIR
jgi:excinuclease UvrABC ATPase subunit